MSRYNQASKLFLGPMLSRVLASRRLGPNFSHALIGFLALCAMMAVGAVIGKHLGGDTAAIWGVILGGIIFGGLVYLGAYGQKIRDNWLRQQLRSLIYEITILNNDRVALCTGNGEWSYVPLIPEDAGYLADMLGIGLKNLTLEAQIEQVLKTIAPSPDENKGVEIKAILTLDPRLDLLDLVIANSYGNTNKAMTTIEIVVAETSGMCPEPDAPSSELSAYQSDLERVVEANQQITDEPDPNNPWLVSRLFILKVCGITEA